MNNTRRLTFTALFAAIATVLMYFEFPLPFMPPFLKVDLSGVAIVIGMFIFGLKPALAMVLIKDLIHLMQTQTAGVGELADFLMLGSFIVVAHFIYKNYHTKKGAVLAVSIGTVTMSIMGVISNYLLIIPFYSNVMPIEAIVSACNAINPMVDSMMGYYFLGVLPFNLIKGFIISVVTIAIYKKLAVFIRKEKSKN